MAVNFLICDWNGTLIGFHNESPLFRAIGKDIFKSALPFKISRIMRMQRGKAKMDVLGEKWGREKDISLIHELFQIFNTSFIDGVPLEEVLRYIDKYAVSAFVQEKLQSGLLNVVRDFSLKGKTTGIFSAACKYPIEKVVAVAGYDKHFDFIEADEIYQADGRAKGFGLNIYGKKPELLEEIFRNRNINPGEVAYIADTEDEAGCFEKVKYPIVSMIATEDTKNKFARETKAFIPEDIKDLENYLKKA
jgi:phosphoglycolate phosphatase-like HAD superfamily hydrolase